MVTGPQIRAARALLGMDQRGLAGLAGLSVPIIQRMEACERLVRSVVDSLEKVVTAFSAAGVELIAGLTVAIVALPLAMALAIASGATPDVGLVTAVVAGFLISAFGGSRFQIGGPTGAFVVIVYGVITKYGYGSLLMATLMTGGILIVAGLPRVGTLIKYIPDPVTTGFTSGIAVITFRGPLFFGSASVLKDAFDQIGAKRRVYILRLEETPMVDPTGAFALRDFLKRVLDDGAEVIVCGAARPVMRSLLKTIEADVLRRARFVGTFDEARRKATPA